MKKDIVLIMSDQHNGNYMFYQDEHHNLTPSLSSIASNSAFFTNAYCNAPLCVPSRMSFLSGKLPSETLILDNDSILNSDEITLAHKVGLEGYETILIGRMHFKGHDQFHGFDKRYVGDITTQFWGQSREDLGKYYPGFKAKTCQEVYGIGSSPVLEFDREVFETTKKVLNEVSDKPRFIVVGFYAPHFPYFTEGKLEFEPTIKEDDIKLQSHKIYEKLIQKTNFSIVQKIESIYMMMIHQIDTYVGELHSVYNRNKDKGIFIYTSDHGDNLGKRGIFGKKVLYQDSIKIPMVIEGLFKNNEYQDAVSLIDLHNWIVEYARNNQPLSVEKDTIAITQQIIDADVPVWTESIVYKHYKLVALDNDISLYDLNISEDESIENDEIENLLKPYLTHNVDSLLKHYEKRSLVNKKLKEHGKMKELKYNHVYEIERG